MNSKQKSSLISKMWCNHPIMKKGIIYNKNKRIIEDDHNSQNGDKHKLPEKYTYCDVTVLDIVNFINSNSTFTFTEEYLNWVLDGILDYCVGIRHNDLLVGVVVARKCNIECGIFKGNVIYVHFVCVHKTYRKKYLLNALIKEIKYRAGQNGIYEGLFISKEVIGHSFVSSYTAFRPINIKKLLDLEFLKLDNKVLIDELEREYFTLPTKKEKGEKFREAEEKDYEILYEIYCDYSKKYILSELLNFEDFVRRFRCSNVVKTYVMVDKNDDVLDFISYYKGLKGSHITTATIFYYTSDVETAYKLILDLIHVVGLNDIDLIMIENIMENDSIMHELKFKYKIQDNHYYFYNRTVPDTKIGCIGMVNMM